MQTPENPPQPNTQAVEKPAHISGKVRGKVPRRLKAKHLALSTRQMIVRLFRTYESYEDVAREMNVAGLSGKTVSEVIHAEQLRIPPGREPMAMVRRMAA